MRKYIVIPAVMFSLWALLFIVKSEAQRNDKSIASAIDTTSLKYFPLAVGNVYKYHFSSSGGFAYDYKVRVLKDTLINSRRYFVINRGFPGAIGQILRMDTASGNAYTRSSMYCGYSPNEELTDSLRARKGDTTFVCVNYITKHFCVDTNSTTLFGFQVKRKSFLRYTTESNTTVSYGMNFGIISASSSDMWGMSAEWMTGCYINGVLYGDTILTDINNISSEVPSGYKLGQNYPNPFNPVTVIRCQLPVVSDVSLKVYDVRGREVQTLVNERLGAGTYEVRFDGSSLNSGVYFYRLITDSFAETRKMLLIK